MDPKQKRMVATRITFPKVGKNFPVIVFSHAVRGSEASMDPLVTYWANNGYTVFQPRHEDSSIDTPNGPRGFPQNPGKPPKLMLSRLADCRFMYAVARNVKQWVPELAGKINPKLIIQAGYVNGAHTSQTLGGVKRNKQSFTSNIPVAFCCISPPGISEDLDEQSWRDFKRPLLVVSGTDDVSPPDRRIPNFNPETHQNPFKLSPAGNKYLLWIQGANNGFGGISGRSEGPGANSPNPHQVRWIQETTLAFFDAVVKGDGKKQHWLKSHNLAAETKGEAVISWR